MPVYWLLPPTHPKLQAWRDEKKADADYERFIRHLQTRFPNLRVIDARHSGYSPDVFWDAVHLDRDGRLAVFTAQIAEVLRDRARPLLLVRGTGHIGPAACRGAPGLLWKNMDQSRLAVAPLLEERR